jgi:hypothetical protein
METKTVFLWWAVCAFVWLVLLWWRERDHKRELKALIEDYTAQLPREIEKARAAMSDEKDESYRASGLQLGAELASLRKVNEDMNDIVLHLRTAHKAEMASGEFDQFTIPRLVIHLLKRSQRVDPIRVTRKDGKEWM